MERGAMFERRARPLDDVPFVLAREGIMRRGLCGPIDRARQRRSNQGARIVGLCAQCVPNCRSATRYRGVIGPRFDRLVLGQDAGCPWSSARTPTTP